MHRFRRASPILVLGLGTALGMLALGHPGGPASAQDEGSPASPEPASDAPDDRRPGQLDDPGDLRVDTSGWSTDFSISAVPYSEIVPGGPGKDGIPAVDDPQFESIAAAREWLDGRAPVIALEIDGDARAYPLAILTWHEIANDVVGGVPVAVTFCPLCHTALVYERVLDGTVYDFGVSGNLRYSDLIMHDRQTESWWQQATGKAIVGELTGAKLPFIASQLIGLDQFAVAHPQGLVMSRDTGHVREYGRNPYAGYDAIDEQPFLFFGVSDGRLSPKERVVTLGEQGREALSFPYAELRRASVAQVEFEGRSIVVLWTPGAVSALDRPLIEASDDVGSTGVFSATVDGLILSFTREGGEATPITDAGTGSTWDVTGRAIDGPLAGTQLMPIPHGDHFWFAWAAFVSHTSIWTADGRITSGSPVAGGTGKGADDDAGPVASPEADADAGAEDGA